MSDIISRQAAIDALGDEPEVWTDEDAYAQGLNNQWHYDRNAINAVPSAQPKIIRCGECTHKDKKIDYCHYLGITICECDYCSYAVRRTDD